MNKRFDIELGVFLHELSKNTFDCDGFESRSIVCIKL